MRLMAPLLLVGCLAAGVGAGALTGRFAAPWLRPAPPAAVSAGDFEADYIVPAGKPVVMFSLSTCPHCAHARTYFAEHGIAYKDYVIDQSTDAHEAFEGMHESGVPVILTRRHKLRGFEPEQLAATLAEDGVRGQLATTGTGEAGR
jgi:glutaredoxin